MSMPALANWATASSQSPPSAAHYQAHFAVISKGLQRAFGHGIDGEGRGKGLDVENIGGPGSLVPVLAHRSRWGRAPQL